MKVIIKDLNFQSKHIQGHLTVGVKNQADKLNGSIGILGTRIRFDGKPLKKDARPFCATGFVYTSTEKDGAYGVSLSI